MEYKSETLQVRSASSAYRRLAGKSRAALEAMLVRGETPSLEGIIGYEYRGYNVAPALSLLGIRKFIKAFFTTVGGDTYGCNTPVVQNGLKAPTFWFHLSFWLTALALLSPFR